MTITLERGDGLTRSWAPTTLRVQTRAQDVTPIRGAYSQAWRAAGSRAWPGPVLVISFDAVRDAEGIAPASSDAAAFLAELDRAALLHCDAGTFVPAGILDTQSTPIVSGYRLTARIAARLPRAADDTGALRFIGGDLWELR